MISTVELIQEFRRKDSFELVIIMMEIGKPKVFMTVRIMQLKMTTKR